MRAPLYQVDAFADAALRGNPAAVMLLDAWLDDPLMKAIAAENNLSETAFLVPAGPGRWGLRWFTPTTEVDLCGHATLGAAKVLFHRGDADASVTFETRSGPLTVRRDGDRLTMDFPAVPVLGPLDDPELFELLGRPEGLWSIKQVHHGRYVLALLADEAAVAAAAPDIAALGRMRTNALVAAPGRDVDVVSRFFAPASGVAEDPVTGSVHCTLAPFWSARLGRDALHCRQISHRPGDVHTRLVGDRVELSGQASVFFEGTATFEVAP